MPICLRIIEEGVDKAYSYVFLLLRNCFIYKLIKTTVCLSRRVQSEVLRLGMPIRYAYITDNNGVDGFHKVSNRGLRRLFS